MSWPRLGFLFVKGNYFGVSLPRYSASCVSVDAEALVIFVLLLGRLALEKRMVTLVIGALRPPGDLPSFVNLVFFFSVSSPPPLFFVFQTLSTKYDV